MSGMGRAYWLNVWDTCHSPNDNAAAAERCLKRYGYLWSGTTHGKQVNKYFYLDKLGGYYYSCAMLHAVITKLQTAIHNEPIYENGDLHQILKIIGEKAHKDENYYLHQFTIIKKSTIGDSFLSLFSCKPTVLETPIIIQGNKTKTTNRR